MREKNKKNTMEQKSLNGIVMKMKPNTLTITFFGVIRSIALFFFMFY